MKTTDTGATMQDGHGAHAITAPMRAAHFKEVESFQKRRARLARFLSRSLVLITAVSMVANVGLAWTVAAMLPLTRLVPVYLLIRGDGTIDTSVSLSSLPASSGQAVIRAALWQYVSLREGFSADSAQYRYRVISGMSDPAIRAAYQKWFNYPNPQSPQVTIGKNGGITVQPISVAFIGPNVAQVRYQREVDMGTSQRAVTTWTATLQFMEVETLPASERLIDPGGIIITSYQNEENTAP